MLQRKWLVAAVFAAMAVVGGIGWVSVNANRAERNRLEAQGTIEATEVSVAPEMSGRVIEVLVQEGQQVKAGDPVARLDPSLLAEQVKQAEAAADTARARVSQAEAALSLVQSQVHGQILQAESAVASAQANLDNARSNWERVRKLFEQGAVPAQQRDTAETAVRVAEAQYEGAVTALKVANAGTDQIDAKRRELEAAKSQQQQAEAALAYARGQQGKAELVAPISGYVLRRHVEPGEFTGPGSPVATLVDPADTWLNVYIPETDIGLVHVGQEVQVQVDSFPGRNFGAEVSEISSRAEFTPKNIQTKKERVNMVFRVKLRLLNDTGELKPGMPADAYWPVSQVQGQ